MTLKIDNIKLDKGNVEFNNAAEFAKHTDKLIYLTGKAGTGKTTFLKYIKKTTHKNTVILAPTGIAAINAGGVTIHSFFQIPFGPFIPDDSRLRKDPAKNKETIFTTFRYREDKRKIIENLELLIIDEISMVRVDMLDVIDQILRVFRKKPHLLFGGVQVILIGDTFQLPPIADDKQWEILSQFYNSPFFFSSNVIRQNTPIYIELKKIYRQKKQKFINLLNRVRVNQVTKDDYQILNSKYNPTFSGNDNDYIILATHNDLVNETNLTKLKQIKTKFFEFEANVKGKFPDKHKPTDHYLKFKVGAQIMFIRNDPEKHKKYFNGKIGKIKDLEDNTITVIFNDKSEVKVERTVWDNIQYTYNKKKMKIEEETIGTFEQFPLKLAWAITVHKSQGLTFKKVIADLSKAFAPGQVYVALSRCTSFKGLVLKTKLNSHAIKTDPRVLKFAKNETPETLVIEQLNTGKAHFYYNKAREEFRKGNIKASMDFFKRAIKFRPDIETEDFERSIENQGQKLNNYILKIINQNKKIVDAKSQSEALKSELSKVKNKNRQIKLELSKANQNIQKKEKVNELNKQEIERLRNLKWYDKLFRNK